MRISEIRAWTRIQAPGLGRCVAVSQNTICVKLTFTQLSAQLKTRLSYAMVKVQNGWEKQSLEELEEVQSQRGSPNSAPGGSRVTFGSPPSSDYRRRHSAVSDSSDRMILSPASDSVRPYALNPGQCSSSPREILLLTISSILATKQQISDQRCRQPHLHHKWKH